MNTMNRFQKGQMIVFFAIAIIALIAALGLAIDTGVSYQERRHAQNVADSAALAAALAAIQGEEEEGISRSELAQHAAELVAQRSGFSGQLVVNIPPSEQDCNPNSPNPYAGGSQGDGEDDGEDDDENKSIYVQVIARSQVSTYVSSIFNRNTMEICTEAIARVSRSENEDDHHGWLGEMAIVTTKPDGSGTFLINGNASVKVYKSSIFVNSNHNQALTLKGGASLQMLDEHNEYRYGYTVSGTYRKVGNASVSAGIKQAEQQTFDANTFSFIPPLPNTPTCSGNGTQTSNGNTITFTPGNFGNITISAGKQAIFNPGVYCLNGNFTIQGNASLTSSSDQPVTFVTGNRNITFNGNVSINIPNFEIYTHNGTWKINGGNNNFTFNRLRFYASGSGSWEVNGSSRIQSNDTLFYLTGGYITWYGSSDLNLKAPPKGDQYAGLLIYMPYGNANTVFFTGGDNIRMTGSYIAPCANLTIGGNTRENAIRSQFVVYTLNVQGGANFSVTYNSDENIHPPDDEESTAIELIR